MKTSLITFGTAGRSLPGSSASAALPLALGVDVGVGLVVRVPLGAVSSCSFPTTLPDTVRSTLRSACTADATAGSVQDQVLALVGVSGRAVGLGSVGRPLTAPTDVLFDRDDLKVIGVHAESMSAKTPSALLVQGVTEVVECLAFRDGTDDPFVGDSMGSHLGEPSVTSIARLACPEPTWGSEDRVDRPIRVDLGPELGFQGCSHSFDPSRGV